MSMYDLAGKTVVLQKPIRDHEGRNRYNEEKPVIVRSMNNLDRQMYLIKFSDGATTFVFPTDIVIE